MDLRETMPANKKFTREKTHQLYETTIKLAAALEKLMNEDEKDEG